MTKVPCADRPGHRSTRVKSKPHAGFLQSGSPGRVHHRPVLQMRSPACVSRSKRGSPQSFLKCFLCDHTARKPFRRRLRASKMGSPGRGSNSGVRRGLCPFARNARGRGRRSRQAVSGILPAAGRVTGLQRGGGRVRGVRSGFRPSASHPPGPQVLCGKGRRESSPLNDACRRRARRRPGLGRLGRRLE